MVLDPAQHLRRHHGDCSATGSQQVRRPCGVTGAARGVVMGMVVGSLLGGCAAQPTAPAPLPWRIEQVYRLTDSTFADAEIYRALAKRYDEEGRHEEAQDARRRAARLLNMSTTTDNDTGHRGVERAAPR